jgi:hypothetical protein
MERNLDSLSSGERKGTSPNRSGVIACGPSSIGVVGAVLTAPQRGRGVTKVAGSRSGLERPATGGNSPVGETFYPPFTAT